MTVTFAALTLWAASQTAAVVGTVLWEGICRGSRGRAAGGLWWPSSSSAPLETHPCSRALLRGLSSWTRGLCAGEGRGGEGKGWPTL